MAQDFYPFVDNAQPSAPDLAGAVRHPARIAVYDDAAAAPRVVVVEPKDVRAYLEEITLQVTQLAQGQGGMIPFMVIREIVENFIHAFAVVNLALAFLRFCFTTSAIRNVRSKWFQITSRNLLMNGGAPI